jgi:hypothetical protein
MQAESSLKLRTTQKYPVKIHRNINRLPLFQAWICPVVCCLWHSVTGFCNNSYTRITIFMTSGADSKAAEAGILNQLEITKGKVISPRIAPAMGQR